MGEPPRSIQTDFSELLRRRRGSGRRLLLLLYLLVMVLVLRGALVRLSGLGLRRSFRSRRSRGALRLGGRRRVLRGRGGGLRGVLCHYRQRQCKHDQRPEDNNK